MNDRNPTDIDQDEFSQRQTKLSAKKNIDYPKLRMILARQNELTDAANALSKRQQEHQHYVRAMVKSASHIVQAEDGRSMNITADRLELLQQISGPVLMRAGISTREIQMALEERELARGVGKKLAAAQAAASRHQNLVNNLKQFAGVPQ